MPQPPCSHHLRREAGSRPGHGMAWVPQPQCQPASGHTDQSQSQVAAPRGHLSPSPRRSKAHSSFHPVATDHTPSPLPLPASCGHLWGTGLLTDIRQKACEPARATKNSGARAPPVWNECSVSGSPEVPSRGLEAVPSSPFLPFGSCKVFHLKKGLLAMNA